jgi:hypothetical protein
MAGCGFFVLAQAAWCGSVNVTLDNKAGTLNTLAARGTVTVDAYSQQGNTKNTNVTSSAVTGGAAAAAGTFAVGSSPSINASYTVGKNILVLKSLGRTVNLSRTAGPTPRSLLNKASLTMDGDNYTITSNTGAYTGMGKASVDADAMGNLIRSVSASAMVAGAMPPSGEAAGRALDPFDTSAASAITVIHNYDPTLNADVDIDAAHESGGVEAFAADSKTFTSDDLNNFDADRDPLGNTLWYLLLGSDEVTSDKSDVGVDFVLNSEDLMDGELSFAPTFLGTVTTDFGNYGSNMNQEATEIDEEIDKDIESSSAFTDVGDNEEFTNLDIMPMGTTLTLKGGEEYADEVDADISVPLPASAISGIVLLIGLGTMQLRRARIA